MLTIVISRLVPPHLSARRPEVFTAGDGLPLSSHSLHCKTMIIFPSSPTIKIEKNTNCVSEKVSRDTELCLHELMIVIGCLKKRRIVIGLDCKQSELGVTGNFLLRRSVAIQLCN